MSQQRVHWLHLLIGLAVSVAAFYGWRLSLSAMPTQLEHASGPITSSEEVRAGRARTVHFHIDGSSQEFTYPSILPAYGTAAEVLKPGNTVAIGYIGPGEPELWELAVNGQPIVQPAGAHEARLSNGKWAFWLFVTFSLSTLYLGWRYRRQSR
ncbi:hypothetical protein [Stenotrophomonas sp. SY1]|uniref:hypothetical protein n=1 Tax=Stenotrophomonas sp. SY1 TaxID=477235 RepID=UPI001E3209D3|nr:hypothetical protein [Stenotrophomonas sp. SY1]MCD9085482.1 hypothetical protein [Stenotrophomonas sp. SY1]